jgi:hypothetical protein
MRRRRLLGMCVMQLRKGRKGSLQRFHLTMPTAMHVEETYEKFSKAWEEEKKQPE